MPSRPAAPAGGRRRSPTIRPCTASHAPRRSNGSRTTPRRRGARRSADAGAPRTTGARRRCARRRRRSRTKRPGSCSSRGRTGKSSVSRSMSRNQIRSVGPGGERRRTKWCTTHRRSARGKGVPCTRWCRYAPRHAPDGAKRTAGQRAFPEANAPSGPFRRMGAFRSITTVPPTHHLVRNAPQVNAGKEPSVHHLMRFRTIDAPSGA